MPYYGPIEPHDWIVTERYFLAGDLIVGVGYGIVVVLFLACAQYLWGQCRERAYARYMLAYIVFLFSIESIFLVVQTITVQLMYVDNRNYPGGPWQYFLDTQTLAVNVIFAATLFSMTFLCDCLVFWRCWVIYTASNRVHAIIAVAFPTMLILASFVMGTLWVLQSSQPGLSFYSTLPQAYGTAYYTISLSINVILTILIITRLLFYRRSIVTTLSAEHARSYVSLATILIESAILYSIFALLFLITYACNELSFQIWLVVASAAQQISTYLIIYRLAHGRGWQQSTLSNTFNTMQFANQHKSSVFPDVEAGHGRTIHDFTISHPGINESVDAGLDSQTAEGKAKGRTASAGPDAVTTIELKERTSTVSRSGGGGGDGDSV